MNCHVTHVLVCPGRANSRFSTRINEFSYLPVDAKKSFNCLDLTLSYDDQSCNSRSLFLTFINFELVQILRRVHESFLYSLNNVQSSLINFHVTHECFLLTRPDWSERSNC